MVWKYAKIVYTQITRNTQEPRIMIKIFFTASLHRCIAEWKSADCVDILWDTSRFGMVYVFFFVIVCQIFHYLYQILFITEAHLTVLLSEIKIR